MEWLPTKEHIRGVEQRLENEILYCIEDIIHLFQIKISKVAILKGIINDLQILQTNLSYFFLLEEISNRYQYLERYVLNQVTVEAYFVPQASVIEHEKLFLEVFFLIVKDPVFKFLASNEQKLDEVVHQVLLVLQKVYQFDEKCLQDPLTNILWCYTYYQLRKLIYLVSQLLRLCFIVHAIGFINSRISFLYIDVIILALNDISNALRTDHNQ